MLPTRLFADSPLNYTNGLFCDHSKRLTIHEKQ